MMDTVDQKNWKERTAGLRRLKKALEAFHYCEDYVARTHLDTAS